MIAWKTKPHILVEQMKAWPHWPIVQQVAEKEYQVSASEFTHRLPEYLRFMALLSEETSLGMGSSLIDVLWHSHMLCTLFYAEFCSTFIGRFVHHSPNLSPSKQIAVICEAPPTPLPGPICEAPPTPRPGEDLFPSYQESSFESFRRAYAAAYDQEPGELWGEHEADGIALLAG